MSDNNIKQTLELMCDTHNPQDRKLLLLADLVDSKCNELAEHQETLNENLTSACEKIDKLTTLIEENQRMIQSCPVYKDMDSFEKISSAAKNPRAVIFMIAGIIAILGGFFGSHIVEWIKFLIR